MSLKKTIIYKICNREIQDKLNKFLYSCLGVNLSKILETRILLCKKDKTIDMYMARKKLAEEAMMAYELGVEPFTIGIHIARVTSEKLTPLLGLASLLRITRNIPPPIGYVKVNETAEKLFLYGRDVFQHNIVEIKPPKCTTGYVLVLNTYNDPLGWALLRKHQNTIYIQNTVDAGWYLRSGV